ncbi:putative tRNA (uracil-O(2)-)-methyltransferase isoform X2 [Tachypleus tridentatus]|uniref:putative tRNA (uracil-O(2)-)-methyltransferase isoform X2 n=1 Tax=Tachypleus tridentatus TaxID=6853 RepID=UPI003FCFF76F
MCDTTSEIPKLKYVWKSIIESCSEVEETDFWIALKVWTEQPHTVNRRLMAVKPLMTYVVDVQPHCHTHKQCFAPDNADKIIDLIDCTAQTMDITSEIHIFRKKWKLVPCEQLFWNSGGTMFLQVRQLLPKQPEKFPEAQEIAVIDKSNRQVIFHPVLKIGAVHKVVPNFTYRITHTEQERISVDILLEDINSDVEGNPAVSWLQVNVLPKLVKWATNKQNSSSNPVIPSLSLVPVEAYNKVYQQLKIRYGKKLIKLWPETTDPLKFIYEDIAIASYLMYPGVGVDLRNRGIWDIYGPETQLKEMTITPSDKYLFPEYDWLIGNHSDELTPWIPVIAARSSFHMRAFLIPCCAFTFDGKYQKSHSGTSQYQSYLNFINELCQVVGFHVKKDKLRIPSTKRICLICTSRNYKVSEEAVVDKRRSEYIKKYSRLLHVRNLSLVKTMGEEKNSIMSHKSFCEHNEYTVNTEDRNPEVCCKSTSAVWLHDFQPREKAEQVRNCTHLDKHFLDETVSVIAQTLLNCGEDYLSYVGSDGKEGKWKLGGKMELSVLVKTLSNNTLKQLKNQCGGLQTLLRNNQHIFSVKKGTAGLASPFDQGKSDSSQSSKKRKGKISVKTRPCWFYRNHPNSCPLDDVKCKFVHVDENIKTCN